MSAEPAADERARDHGAEPLHREDPVHGHPQEPVGVAATRVVGDAVERGLELVEALAGGRRAGNDGRAVEEGALPADRLASYHKLQREAVVAAMKTDARLRAAETRKWKIIHKSVDEIYRLKGKKR